MYEKYFPDLGRKKVLNCSGFYQVCSLNVGYNTVFRYTGTDYVEARGAAWLEYGKLAKMGIPAVLTHTQTTNELLAQTEKEK